MSPIFNRAPSCLALACLSMACAAAHAGDMVTLSITNNDTDDILVTVYDMNTQPHNKVLDGQKISGFASVPISVAAGAGGTGHVYWRATTLDPDMPRCGHRDKAGLSNEDSVHVFAHSQCPAAHPKAKSN
jgi:hypothetical protein